MDDDSRDPEQINAAGDARVRVLILAPGPLAEPWVGGISNFIRSFVNHMPDDFEVSICGVSVADAPYEDGWHSITVAGRTVRFLTVARLAESGRPGLTPVKGRALVGLIRRRRRIASNGFILQVHAPGMELALAGRGMPTIRVVHNAPENLVSPETGTRWRHFGWALRRTEVATFSRADRVFFVDRSTYEHYVSRGRDAAKRMRYLPNGVDTELFQPACNEERQRLRVALARELDVPAAPPWILFAGRLDRQKDPGLMMRTFAAVRRLSGLGDSQLIVAGRGPLRDDAHRAARAAGVSRATHFVGAVPHGRLPEFMAAADVFVMPSAYEGAPFVVLEALACGLPVVSTSVGDVPQLVQHARTGWLVEGRHPRDLAAGVAWAIAQPRDEIAERCAASMEPFRIESVLAPFYDEHRRLAASASHR